MNGSGFLTPRPGRFTPGKDALYPLYRKLDGLQGRSGRVRKISPPTGIRSPDHPTRSESLYRLRYPGPPSNCRIRSIVIYRCLMLNFYCVRDMMINHAWKLKTNHVHCRCGKPTTFNLSLHCSDLSFFAHCRPRCTVRT